MNLYKITNDFQSLFNLIEEDGVITEAISESMQSLSEDFEKKAIAVASYIKNLEAEEKAINDAIEEMKTRKLKLIKKADSLSEYLQYNMQNLAIIEIKSSPYFKIKIKKCPASVDVHDERLIPSNFWKEKIVMSIDKIKIKELLTEGIEIPGASIKHNIKLEIK